jgi:hypothetical protein
MMRPLVAFLLLALPAITAESLPPSSPHQQPGRALQQAAGDEACADLVGRSGALNDECCDEPSEDCSSGRPATCNLGCAHVLLPFFEDCADALGPTAAGQFDDVVRLCHGAETSPPVRTNPSDETGCVCPSTPFPLHLAFV